MKKSDIIDAIEQKVGNTAYKSWTVGVTDNPDRRKSEHDNPKHWKHWNPDGEKDARKIEEHFLAKGMKGGGGGPGDADYVYIF